MMEMKKYFSDLVDSRDNRGLRHTLVDIVVTVSYTHLIDKVPRLLAMIKYISFFILILGTFPCLNTIIVPKEIKVKRKLALNHIEC